MSLDHRIDVPAGHIGIRSEAPSVVIKVLKVSAGAAVLYFVVNHALPHALVYGVIEAVKGLFAS